MKYFYEETALEYIKNYLNIANLVIDTWGQLIFYESWIRAFPPGIQIRL